MKKFIVQTIVAGIILMLVITHCSCTKEMECGQVYFITQFFSLDGVQRSEDTTWRSESVVCGEQFLNYKIQEERDTLMVADCINGETIGYQKHIVKTN